MAAQYSTAGFANLRSSELVLGIRLRRRRRLSRGRRRSTLRLPRGKLRLSAVVAARSLRSLQRRLRLRAPALHVLHLLNMADLQSCILERECGVCGAMDRSHVPHCTS
jgi:hypothetical protein